MDMQPPKEIILAAPVKEEDVSPEEFLRMDEHEKANIKESRIIPPKLGSNGWGKIHISYNFPVYKTKYS